MMHKGMISMVVLEGVQKGSGGQALLWCWYESFLTREVGFMHIAIRL